MFTLASNVPIALKEQKRERVWFTQNFLYHHPLRNRVMFKVNWFISSILVAFFTQYDIMTTLIFVLFCHYNNKVFGINVQAVSVGAMTF